MQLLHTGMLVKGVRDNVNSTWLLVVSNTAEEGAAALDHAQVRVVVASLVLRARFAMDQFTDGAVFGGSVDNELVDRDEQRLVLCSVLAP